MGKDRRRDGGNTTESKRQRERIRRPRYRGGIRGGETEGRNSRDR
jgi:hypothetical protein